MRNLYVLNGPNLNLLGTREPEKYGAATLSDLEADLARACAQRGVTLIFRQTNSEGELVTWLQEAGLNKAPVILNAGAYTHTSIALADAISGACVDVIEVHITNVHAREAFRHHSTLSRVARGVILGFGVRSYMLALEAFFPQNQDMDL